MIVGKTYSWGPSGFITFRDTYLATTWGRGTYEKKDNIVSAAWNNHVHTLVFSDDFTRYTSVRTKPNDLDVMTGKIYNKGATVTEFLHSSGCDIIEGYCEQIPQQCKDLINLTNTPNIDIMEIGFNAGHSAELFLKNNPTLTLTSFDLGSHDYVLTAKKYIDETYPNRHTLILGDSTLTVPKYTSETNKKFDVIFIDGGHDYAIAAADLENCMKLAHSETIVILDDTAYTQGWEKVYTVGPTKAWIECVNNKKISEIKRTDYCGGRGMSWGKYIINIPIVLHTCDKYKQYIGIVTPNVEKIALQK
jgi:hypothetical protein